MPEKEILESKGKSYLNIETNFCYILNDFQRFNFSS